jgi:hypothetical protein
LLFVALVSREEEKRWNLFDALLPGQISAVFPLRGQVVKPRSVSSTAPSEVGPPTSAAFLRIEPTRLRRARPRMQRVVSASTEF